MGDARLRVDRHGLLLVAFLILTVSTYIKQVTSMPADTDNEWPTFPRRNIQALARGGFLKNSATDYKRSISVLAKNGLLPTYRSPYVDAEKNDEENEDAKEKRNIASIARMRSYSAMKRNIQALARDGYRVGRGQYNQASEYKRNIAALARNGLIHKKDDNNGEEYFYPFYQNSIPPLSEIEGPVDINEIYDFQQSVNPDMFPPLSQVYKRSFGDLQNEYDNQRANYDNNWYFKRGAMGMPVHGLYRPMYIDPTSRTKRYIFSIPDVLDTNDLAENDNNENEDKRSVDEETRDNFEKRHIGSLARLGLLPSFRFTGGRYSRSGRARLLLPSQEMYRKHSDDENFGIREYISRPETVSADSDDSDVSGPAVPPLSHPTGRLLHRPLSNDFPNASGSLPSPPLLPTNYDVFNKNRWQSNSKDAQKYYYFRSLKVPYHNSGKRYLLLPAVDNLLLRKTYRNSSLPSRRKNQ